MNGLQTRQWAPILDGARREAALGTIGRIADELSEQTQKPPVDEDVDNWSLGNGRSGMALLFAYLGEAQDDDTARELAVELIGDALEHALQSASLYAGLVGVAWTLEHLSGALIDLSDGDPNDAVDTALLELLRESALHSEYDLIAGLVGVGVYAVERLPRPSAIELTRAVFQRLVEAAEWDATGGRWFSPPDRLSPHLVERFPRGAYNLGVAHGVPGVIGFLGKACRGTGEPRVRRVLDDAVGWLLAQQLSTESASVFSALVAPDVVRQPARSAWCYGDPGIAAALLVAARSVGQPDWEIAALTIAERAAFRPRADCGVVDASVCHGAAGLGHIFNRLYQATGRVLFREAALHWLDRLLADSAAAEAGFLEGAAGIGLVLLAAATPLEPRWDRVLLMS